MWGSIFSLSVQVLIVTTLLFQSLRLISVIKDTSRSIKEAEELLFIFNILKEDILKSRELWVESNSIVVRGFLMYVSNRKSDFGWGIVLSCEGDGRAKIYNIKPKNYLYFLSEGIIFSKQVFAKFRTSDKSHEVLLPNCEGLKEGTLVFSDFFEVKWYSKDRKIIREVKRYAGEDGRVKLSKQLAGYGRIKVERNHKHYVVSLLSEDEKFKISFAVGD